MSLQSERRDLLVAVCGLAVGLLPLRVAAMQDEAAAEPEPIAVRLFTPDGKEVTDRLQINATQRTVVLVHGWQGFYAKVMKPYYDLAKAFQERDPKANVLVVEWTVPNNGPVQIPGPIDPAFWFLRNVLAPIEPMFVPAYDQGSRAPLIPVTCPAGHDFAVMASFSGCIRPCPECGAKCRVP